MFNHIADDFLRGIDQEIRAVLEKYEDTLVADSSELVYVDGEEGDYGKIKYTDPIDGRLICTKIIEGGDREEYEFTKWGKGQFFAFFVSIAQELSLKHDRTFKE